VAGLKFTRYGWSKYQVPVDLPDDWTDILEVIPRLNEAVRLYNEAATRAGEPSFRSGADLFFSWAADGHLEVSACWPTPHSDRQVLRLDPSEWRHEYFRSEGSRLHHLASGLTYYALQAWARRSGAQTAPVETPSTSAPGGVREVRAAMLYKATLLADPDLSKRWTFKKAFALPEVRRHPEISGRMWEKAWPFVRKKLATRAKGIPGKTLH